jgi:hypothetical protein
MKLHLEEGHWGAASVAAARLLEKSPGAVLEYWAALRPLRLPGSALALTCHHAWELDHPSRYQPRYQAPWSHRRLHCQLPE